MKIINLFQAEISTMKDSRFEFTIKLKSKKSNVGSFPSSAYSIRVSA